MLPPVVFFIANLHYAASPEPLLYLMFFALAIQENCKI